MPLVPPGMNSSMAGNQSEWSQKLMGKTLTDSTSDVNSFSKTELPQSHRVLKPGDMKTMDIKPDRLNIHVDEAGVVKDVKFG